MTKPLEPLLHIVLHQPEIPHNTGNVGRTCVAVGAKLWLVQPLGFQLDDRHLRRAGLDYWQHLDWEMVVDVTTLQDKLPTKSRIWYFSAHADRHYTDAEFREGDALLFGSESAGLPDSFRRRHSDRGLRIPVSSVVRSLNLSNAVAVATYEALRQIGGDSSGSYDGTRQP